MRTSEISAGTILVAMAMAVSAVPEIIYKQDKRNYWKDFNCHKHYNCPGIWSRDIGNYTEVCFKTGTEWFEINLGFANVPSKWMQRFIMKTFKYFMLLNKVHLKHPKKTKSLVWLTTSRKEEAGITANYLTGRILAPEILNGHRLKIPCDPENIHEYPKTEAALCNANVSNVYLMLKRNLMRKCFYGIPRNHDIHRFQGLKNHYQELQKNMAMNDNDVFHPISIFYPPLENEQKHGSSWKYFETNKYLVEEE